MSLGQAYAICPDVVALSYDEDLYRAAQGRVLDICAAYVPAIEPFSLHEVFLDLARAGEPTRVMWEVMQRVTQAGFTCRAGVGASKLVARIAALEAPVGRACPDPPPRENDGEGHPRPTSERTRLLEKVRPVVIPKGQEPYFLAPLPLSRLWLLDEGMIEHLEALGITTIGLLQQIPVRHLVERFGQFGRRLNEFAHGVDRCPVRACYPPPLVEVHLSLAEGVEDMTVIEAALRRLAREAAERLRRRARGCRRLGLEMATDDRGSLSRWRRLGVTISSEGEIFRAAEGLLARILEPTLGRAKPMAPITRLVLRAADLQFCAGAQLDLSGEREPQAQRRERLNQVIALAQQRFGARGVRWGREVALPRRERMLAVLEGGASARFWKCARGTSSGDKSPHSKVPEADCATRQP